MPQYNADILPDITGRNIGAPDTRFDIWARRINVSEGIFGAGASVTTTTPGLENVPYSATPVFDAAENGAFAMTLTGNVSSSTLQGGIAGETVTFILRQDATGGSTFAWPANVLGGMDIGEGANEVSIQEFIFDGFNYYPKTTGVIL